MKWFGWYNPLGGEKAPDLARSEEETKRHRKGQTEERVFQRVDRVGRGRQGKAI